MAVTMLPCPRRPVGAVVNGCPPDEGVMVKLGMAIAWEAPVFLLRDDVRRRTDSETYPLNLMLFIGLPETGRDASWHASIGKLADLEKAPGRWLTGPVAGECSRRGPGDGRGSGQAAIPLGWAGTSPSGAPGRLPARALPGSPAALPATAPAPAGSHRGSGSPRVRSPARDER